MGEFGGFITDKLEIKFLILYIADRLIEPAPFEMLQDLAMRDKGVDYFAFSECMADLVRTEHLTLVRDRYQITQKGRDNIRACETHLPYSVRKDVDRNIEFHNLKLQRDSMVFTEVLPQQGGSYRVILGLNDDYGILMKSELMVTQERTARKIQRNFQRSAESLYIKMIDLLTQDPSGEKP